MRPNFHMCYLAADEFVTITIMRSIDELSEKTDRSNTFVVSKIATCPNCIIFALFHIVRELVNIGSVLIQYKMMNPEYSLFVAF